MEQEEDLAVAVGKAEVADIGICIAAGSRRNLEDNTVATSESTG